MSRETVRRTNVTFNCMDDVRVRAYRRVTHVFSLFVLSFFHLVAKRACGCRTPRIPNTPCISKTTTSDPSTQWFVRRRSYDYTIRTRRKNVSLAFSTETEHDNLARDTPRSVTCPYDISFVTSRNV